MKTSQTFRQSRHKEGGFSRLDLCAVIAAMLLLAGIVLPAIGHTTRQTEVVECASNLRQYGMALHIYGAENNDYLPNDSAGYWAWDVARYALNFILRTGVKQSALYCPSTAPKLAESDNLILFNYTTTYGVVGYASTLPGLQIFEENSSYSTNVNTTLSASRSAYLIGGLTFYMPNPPASRVLVADVTATTSGSSANLVVRKNYNWVSVQGGYSKPMTSAHLSGNIPAGSNLGMLDGHVEWRNFLDARVIARGGGTGIPYFYW